MSAKALVWSAFAAILVVVALLKLAGYLLELEWIRQSARSEGWTLVRVKKRWWRSTRIASFYEITLVDLLGQEQQRCCRVISWGKVEWMRGP